MGAGAAAAFGWHGGQALVAAHLGAPGCCCCCFAMRGACRSRDAAGVACCGQQPACQRCPASQPAARSSLTASAATCPAHCRRGFKALKQVIKIQARLGRHDEMVAAYRRLLDYSAVVTRNAAEKKINSVLDFVSAQATDSQLLQARGGGGRGGAGRAGRQVCSSCSCCRCCCCRHPCTLTPRLARAHPPTTHPAGLLLADPGLAGRGQERAAVVQDQRQAGQPAGVAQGGRQGGKGAGARCLQS